MRTYLEAVNIQTLVDNELTCGEKTTMLEKIVSLGMNSVLPMKKKTIITNEPPWLNKNLKKMIRARQEA
jgi:hypothetical protein